MSKYRNLERLIRRHSEDMLANTVSFIQNGYCLTWNDRERENCDPDRGLKQYSTDSAWAKYQDGRITRWQAVELAVTRAKRSNAKYAQKRLDSLQAAEETPRAQEIRINVEWKKSSMWGYNPTATVSAGKSNGAGKASGCGYDKGSAAISNALMECPSVLRVLFDYTERQLANGATAETLANNRLAFTWGNILGYGAGYDCIPGFEGGVGFDSTAAILEKIGYKKIYSDRSCRTHDTYYFELQEEVIQ